MNKRDLAEKVAVAQGIPEKDASKVVEAVLQAITSSLSQGEAVKLHGFGTFVAKTREARTGVNPKTGERIQIAATTTAKFKVGKSLKDRLKS